MTATFSVLGKIRQTHTASSGLFISLGLLFFSPGLYRLSHYTHAPTEGSLPPSPSFSFPASPVGWPDVCQFREEEEKEEKVFSFLVLSLGNSSCYMCVRSV